jgi:hypothetical protein
MSADAEIGEVISTLSWFVCHVISLMEGLDYIAHFDSHLCLLHMVK